MLAPGSPGLHGGYCCVELPDGRRLGVGHRRYAKGVFLQRFFAVRAAPPFDVVALSANFCLEPCEGVPAALRLTDPIAL